jgi:hypothetical protein
VKTVVYAFKIEDEWRFSIGSRTGDYEVCFSKEDAKKRGEDYLWANGGGELKVFDNEKPLPGLSISV